MLSTPYIIWCLKHFIRAVLFLLQIADTSNGWGLNIVWGGVGRMRGTREIGWPAKEGAKFYTLPKGGGAKIFSLDHFFSKLQKHIFFMCLGYLGLFSFFGPRGAKNLRCFTRGGAKFFRRVLKGGPASPLTHKYWGFPKEREFLCWKILIQ